MSAVRFIAILAFASVAAACAPQHARERPFTREWGDHVKGQRAFDARRARIEGQMLDPKDDRARAGIVLDEQGDPKLRVGRRRGLSADFDYDRGPEGRIKYRHEFEFARPR